MNHVERTLIYRKTFKEKACVQHSTPWGNCKKPIWFLKHDVGNYVYEEHVGDYVVFVSGVAIRDVVVEGGVAIRDNVVEGGVDVGDDVEGEVAVGEDVEDEMFVGDDVEGVVTLEDEKKKDNESNKQTMTKFLYNWCHMYLIATWKY